jgi:hypothetical protein
MMSDLIIIYKILKFFAFMAEGALSLGSLMIAIIIFGLIQLAVGRIVDGKFYIPYSGIYVLIVNLPLVLNNIWGFADLGKKMQSLINKTASPEVLAKINHS